MFIKNSPTKKKNQKKKKKRESTAQRMQPPTYKLFKGYTQTMRIYKIYVILAFN